MSGGPVIPVGFRARSEPLVPAAAAAAGAVARRLAARLLAHGDDALAKLAGVARGGAEPVLVVLGEAADLPWVDGVLYLGRDPRAPALLVPTLLEPDVPIELVARAVVRRASAVGPSPFALLPDVPAIVPCGGALPIARARLVALGKAG
jgi:hypothetical protein